MEFHMDKNQLIFFIKLVFFTIFSSISLNAIADSYIYLTNSTPNTVTIDVKQSGGQLTKNNQWSQEASKLAPYETKAVLRVNRYKGLKSGQTYIFDTTISNGTSKIILNQEIKGTWLGSNIKHGARSSDFNSYLKNDRNIHRYNTVFSNQNVETAFKASSNFFSYDDFHYVINSNVVNETVSKDDNTLKILTYNVYSLPTTLSNNNITGRLKDIPNQIKGYDVVMFQEVFSSHREPLLNTLSSEYPYQTYIPKRSKSSLFNFYDSGVIILSRYPIEKMADQIYSDCTGKDCFAEKGLVYAKILKGKKAYHVFNTHTAAYETDKAREIRFKQIHELKAFIDKQKIPSNEAVLIGGDLNINKLIHLNTDYKKLLEILNVSAPISTGYHSATYAPSVNKWAKDGGDDPEYLDFVFWSNAHRQPTQSVNDVRVLRSTSESMFNTWDLSDHFPVKGEFKFSEN